MSRPQKRVKVAVNFLFHDDGSSIISITNPQSSEKPAGLTSLRKILERYQIHKDAKVVSRSVQESKQLPVGHTNLCRGTDLLQMVQRHFEEQKVENLDVTELTQLQHLLDAILSQIRVKKSQLMMKAVTAIQEKQQQQQPPGKGKQVGKEVEEVIEEATVDGGDKQQEAVPQQSEDPFGELEELYNYSTHDDTNAGGVLTAQQEDAMFYLMYGGGKV